MFGVKSFIVLIFVSLCSPAARAHTPRVGQIHGFVGPYIYSTNFSSVDGYGAAPMLTGFGLGVQGDVDKNGGIEIAIFHTLDYYKRERNGLYLIEKTKRVRISTGYRHWAKPNLGLGIALYSTYSIGDSSTVHNQFAPLRPINTSAEDVTEYGFDFSLQWEFWQNEQFSAFLDGRYGLSVTNKDHEDGDQYGLLIAFKFKIQDSSLKPTKTP